ncbi:MAG: diguanylate cyclase, partial [Defluviitaleaceae bacterium]|nr:diguanylate cyclase [Defluviitaleaceae bacterium]
MRTETLKKTILIIDDTPMQIRILSQILSPIYDIKVALNGEKGLDLANRHNVDLILLDILMDGLSGFEVLEVLKRSEKTSSIPIIFTTSMTDIENEVKGLSLGAVDYITKPFVDEVVRLRVGLHIKLIDQMRFIEQSTLYDALTGIYNRQAFNLTFAKEWENAMDNGHCISLIMLDIDKFKTYNDTYGHISGDKCLITVAGKLKIRDLDMVYRWGGEEFAILLPNIPLVSAEKVAERVRKAVEETPIEYAPGEFTYVTISLGVGTLFPTETDKPQEFCNEVDRALYQA